MDNKPFALLLLVLVVAIAVAVWQFYSLAWGESRGSLRHLSNAPSVAASPH